MEGVTSNVESPAASESVSESASAAVTVSAQIASVPRLAFDGLAAHLPVTTKIKSAAIDSAAGLKPAAAAAAAAETSAAPSDTPSAAVRKVKAVGRHVEKIQGSFGVINNLLQSFTAGKAAKSVTAKKSSTLTDAQARHTSTLPVSYSLERILLNAAFIT